MTLRAADHTITGSDFNRLFGCCVYAWKRGDQFLYVGVSSNGFNRVKSHNIIDKAELVLPDDLLMFWWFDDWNVANEFEQQMIRATKAKYSVDGLERMDLNPRACLTCKTVFNPVRRWQKYCSRVCGGTTKRKLYYPKLPPPSDQPSIAKVAHIES